jgi:hypothetical protein
MRWTRQHSVHLGAMRDMTEEEYFALLYKYMPSAFADEGKSLSTTSPTTCTQTITTSVHVDCLKLHHLLKHEHIDVAGVYDPVAKAVDFAQYKAVVELLRQRGASEGGKKTYVHLTHPTAKGHFPHPLFLKKLDQGDVILAQGDCEPLRPIDAARCEMTLILSADGRRITKVMMAGIESNFNPLFAPKTVEELGCRSLHIPKALREMKISNAEQLIQAAKVCLVGKYAAFRSASPSAKAVDGARKVIRELGGDGDVAVEDLSEQLAALFVRVASARDATRLHKKLGRAVLANSDFFKASGGTAFVNYEAPFNADERSLLGVNALLMAAITLLRVGTDSALREMVVFDGAHGIVTVEGANHCSVKLSGDCELFGGYEVDTVWGKLGCPRDVQAPDALATVKGGKPMVGTLGNGLRLFHMVWEAAAVSVEQDILDFLGLEAPVTLANAEASAAAVLDRVFDMMHALATAAAV